MDILYRDEWLAAVYKPAGMLVHRTKIDPREMRVALQAARDALGQRVYPVHRLDKPVAGVLLLALSPAVARAMVDRFSAGQVAKRYIAVVRGYTAEQGVIDYPLREELDAVTDSLADRDKAAQSAVTAYMRLATAELPFAVGRYGTARYSLLQVRPRTGRKHQIRRHMKHIFHPIVGDTTHGDGRHNQFFREHFGCSRLLLAATSLGLAHPVTGADMTLHAPLDEEFRQVLAALGWEEGAVGLSRAVV